MEHKPPSRNPAGLQTDKPIALRLMPAERAEAMRMAATAGISLSAHGRQCYLMGKKLLLASMPSSPRKRLKRGSGGNPAPASSLPVA